MPSTFGGSPTTSTIDAMRVVLGDTDMTQALLDDGTLTWFYQVWDQNLYKAAAAAAESLAATYAREIAYSADAVSVGIDQLQQHFAQLAVSLRDQAKRLAALSAGPYVGGASTADKKSLSADNDFPGVIFATGITDNLRGGVGGTNVTGGGYASSDDDLKSPTVF